MPDVPFPKNPEPERDEAFAAKLVQLRNKLDDATRIALAGDTTSRIRRKLLFTVALIGGVIASFDGSIFTEFAGLAGLVALLALAMTDNEVTDLYDR